MPRFSPSVQRVVAVLNLFADHPDQAFTLTDIVRTLKLSRATCHGLLVSLADAGYLYRTTDKSYVLGAALLHVGEMAKEHFSPLKVAQPELRALADEFDAVCIAAFRERGDVVVRERATSRSHLGYITPRDTRFPLMPQFAASFFARSNAAEIKAWAKQLEHGASAQQLEQLNESVDFVRKHGFMFCVVKAGSDTERLEERSVVDAPLVPEFTLKAKEIYDLAFLSAPVCDANKQVAFVVALNGLRGKRKGAEVERAGQMLRDACDRISAAMLRPSPARS
jgi:DNA-binding IclR family transcriptional regulator